MTVSAMIRVALVLIAPMTSMAQDKEGFALSPGFSYFSYEDRGGSPAANSRQSGTLVDFRLGYQMSSGLYLGANYMSNNYRDEGVSSSSDSNVTGLGAQIGYFLSGWHLFFTYYFQSELKPNSSLRFASGTGTQFDLGYRWMWGSVGFGPYLSVRNLVYTQQFNSGTAVTMSENRKWDRIYPYFALWIVP